MGMMKWEVDSVGVDKWELTMWKFRMKLTNGNIHIVDKLTNGNISSRRIDKWEYSQGSGCHASVLHAVRIQQYHERRARIFAVLYILLV